MGLLKAGIGALGGVLADQWREYFYCEAIPMEVMAVKGQKRVSGRSSNTKGGDNIISNGSIVAVADGQCMIIVEQGKVVEVCAEPGEFVYDSATEPSIFYGGLGAGIKATFQNIGKRFTFGGEAPMDQRVYYFNTKELIGNKYGTASPVPFRVVDRNIGLDVDIAIRCFGEYSYKIADPLLFYTNVCGNISDDYTRATIEGQLKTELLTALQPAFAKISDMGIRYSALPGHTMELSEALNEVLSAKWKDLRGLEIVSFGVSSVTASEEDEQMIKDLQKTAVYRNANMAGAALVDAQAQAMKDAANNQGGAMTGFLGMGMAMNAGGGTNAGALFQLGQQQQQAAPAPAAEGWKCSCGANATGNFCPNCGGKKPEPKPFRETWKCACGATPSGNFCPECGAKKPEAPKDGTWTCACGSVNKGKFCPNCGSKKPEAAPSYKCSACGFSPADPKSPPKFCPECGNKFSEKDII